MNITISMICTRTFAIIVNIKVLSSWTSSILLLLVLLVLSILGLPISYCYCLLLLLIGIAHRYCSCAVFTCTQALQQLHGWPAIPLLFMTRIMTKHIHHADASMYVYIHVYMHGYTYTYMYLYTQHRYICINICI